MVFIRWAETATPMINIHVLPNKNDTTTNTSHVSETQQRANMKKFWASGIALLLFFGHGKDIHNIFPFLLQPENHFV
ncbi:MAG: hypothetical protein PWQ69_398 [Methanomicrobiaceae archaeon]|nr:hypothetical protein [Methanomicrobiaceae archaeon]